MEAEIIGAEMMEILLWTKIILSLAVSCSAIAAFCAVFLSWLTVKRAAASKRTEVHSKFQFEVRAIQRQFTQAVNHPANWTPTQEEKRYIRMYWYLVFDEWLLTQKEDRSLRDLWGKYYSQGVISALKNPRFVEDLKLFLGGESALFGYRAEFRDTINELYGVNNSGNKVIID